MRSALLTSQLETVVCIQGSHFSLGHLTFHSFNQLLSLKDERSQHRNKEKAMKILRARIYEQQRIAAIETRAASVKEQGFFIFELVTLLEFFSWKGN